MITPKSPFHFAVLLSLLLMISACKKHQTQVADDLHKYSTPDVEETDPLMIKYQAQLTEIFGNTELDLIRRYRQRYQEIKSDEDFYHLFNRTKTLITALEKDLRLYSNKCKKNNTPLPDLTWFSDVAQGMSLHQLPGDYYKLFLNHETLMQQAIKTKGYADDHFIELLILAYPQNSQFPKWLRLDDVKYAACSSLGGGMHFEVLEKINQALLESDIFESDIEQLHDQLMYDVLNQSVYCNSRDQVTQEMKQILTEAHIKRSEKPRLQARLDMIEKNNSESMQFDCNNGNCKYPSS